MSDESEEDSGLDPLKPIGQGDRLIEDGDSIDAIADEVGHFWQTIWDDPANADLKGARDSRNILLPGDRVTIPPLRPKTESRETDLIHQFKRKGVPLIIRFQAVDADREPYANCDYVLRLGKRRYSGKTDQDGKIEQYVSPSAKQAVVTVEIPETDTMPAMEKVWNLRIGGMRPADSVAGCQARLRNLGFPVPSIDGEFGPDTASAVRAFQRKFALEITGDLNEETVDKIQEEHGS